MLKYFMSYSSYRHFVYDGRNGILSTISQALQNSCGPDVKDLGKNHSDINTMNLFLRAS
jgi:hypothetical protein